MKNVNKNFISFFSEKKDKLKKPIKNLDSLSSFKTSKQIKTKANIAPSSDLSILRRNSQLFPDGKSKGNFITIRPKNIPKNVKSIVRDIRSKKLSELKPMKSIIKYARDKIQNEYISPYISRLIQINKEMFKSKKEEDKPIYYNLYKINEIFNNKKSKFNVTFLEKNIFLSENEYLIKSFNKKEIKIILRYLLGFIFLKDKYSLSKSDRFNHKTKQVYSEFFDYINNDYTIIDPENQKNPISTNHRNILESNFLTNNLLALSLNAESDKRNYPFLKTPNYFLIKDMPKKFVPNAIPNYYFNGNIYHIIIKKSAFFKKFNINYEVVKNINNMNNVDKGENFENDNNSSYIVKDKLVNKVVIISDDSEQSEQSNINNNKISINKDKDRDEDNNMQNEELVKIKKLIKNFEEKKEPKKVHFQKIEVPIKQKKHITIKKKKKIKKPYEYYEIIQTDDFIIKKREKPNIFQIFNDEMFKSNSDKLRSKRKHKTRLLTKNLNRNFEKMKTFNKNNETFKRKNRFFLTYVNQNNFINNEYNNFNKGRNQMLNLFKKNIFMKEFNTSLLNNNTNIKYKIYNTLDLVKQKKISFHIYPKLNVLKFQDTSHFLNRINNSFKQKNSNKKLLKSIIIKYQKDNSKSKINSLFFPEIYNFGINSISKIKKTKHIKRNENKTITYKNNIFTSNESNYKDIFNIGEIIKHKKIKI